MASYCPGKDQVLKFNPRPGLESITSRFSGALCVEDENNPISSRSYDTIDSMSDSEISSTYSQRYDIRLPAVQTAYSTSSSTTTTTSDVGYSMLDTVLGGTYGDSSITELSTGTGFVLTGINTDGSCSTSATSYVSVNFGQSSTFSCYLRLSSADFQTLCLAGVASTYPLVTNSDYTGFAKYKTASWSSPSEFVERSHTTLSDLQGTYDGTTGVCTSMVTDITYEFVYAYSGNLQSPIMEIVASRSVHQRAARLLFIASDPPASAAAETDGVERTTLVLTAHVSWERAVQDESIITSFPPLPSVSISVPRDLFYPFVVAEEYSAGQGNVPVMELVAAFCLLGLTRI